MYFTFREYQKIYQILSITDLQDNIDSVPRLNTRLKHLYWDMLSGHQLALQSRMQHDVRITKYFTISMSVTSFIWNDWCVKILKDK